MKLLILVESLLLIKTMYYYKNPNLTKVKMGFFIIFYCLFSGIGKYSKISPDFNASVSVSSQA